MKKKAVKIGVASLLFILALAMPREWMSTSLYVISYLIVGLEIVVKAIKNIIRGKILDENFLMFVATIGAFSIREFPEATAVILFYQLGEWFQSYATHKSRKSIASLMDIRPDFANVYQNGTYEKIVPEKVHIGDTILVKPGEKIPLDGMIIEGASFLDTKALTGESIPRKVSVGKEVLSGCVNQEGILKIKVTKEYNQSTVSKILDLVENASSKKTTSEKFITKFAKYYTPIVVVLALLLACFPPLFFKNEPFTIWIYRALSFLVVSCPCALVISVPLSFFGGIGGASKLGILIKGSNYLEGLNQTKIVVFDKTGTLTEGVFEVQKIEVNPNYKKNDVLKYATHAEYHSNHPIALSLKKACEKIDTSLIMNTKEIAGHGVLATIGNKEVLVGNEKLMKKHHISYTPCKEIGTTLYVAIDQAYAGYIVIADTIKQDAKDIIKMLKKRHIKTVMLTGDHKEVAQKVARQLGIDEVYAELLPTDKVAWVEKWMKQKDRKEKLIFVGDGMNDAPVLALADIGIAMGGLGSDAAIEAADVVIMTDEPSKIEKAIQISEKTMKIVKENIYFAILVKIGVLILSALGISTMWTAVFADVGVSVLAILNALRALKVK